MDVPEERKDICPVCLQPIEPDDEVVQEGERDVHVLCHQEENEIISGDNPLNHRKHLQSLIKP